MLHEMATNIAHFFSSNSDVPLDKDDIEVYAYGTELLLASVLETLALLALGIFFHKTLETLVFFSAFMPLRSYAGGYHAKTHLRCFCGMLMIFAAFLAFQVFTPIGMIKYILLVSTFVSAFPIFILAPVPNPNRPIGVIERKKFRKSSLIVYLIQAVIIVGLSIAEIIPYITLGFAFGQLSASVSLVAAKVGNYSKGGETDDCN